LSSLVDREDRLNVGNKINTQTALEHRHLKRLGAQHPEIDFQGWAPIDFINSHREAGDFRRKHLKRR